MINHERDQIEVGFVSLTSENVKKIPYVKWSQNVTNVHTSSDSVSHDELIKHLIN